MVLAHTRKKGMVSGSPTAHSHTISLLPNVQVELDAFFRLQPPIFQQKDCKGFAPSSKLLIGPHLTALLDYRFNLRRLLAPFCKQSPLKITEVIYEEI